MLSEQAAVIRASLEPETPDPNSTVEAERLAWEKAVLDDELAPGMTETAWAGDGVSGLWIESDQTPADASVIVYAHGGGLTAGSPATHRAFASRLAKACDASVLLVAYRLLPESSFPAPVDDVLAAVDELVASGRASAHQIVLAGDSSGAGLAMGASCQDRDRGTSTIAGIVSLSGAFDATLTGESVDAGQDPQLSRAVLEHWQQTIASAADLKDPLLSPMFASLHTLPPTFLLAGGDEVWLSDSIRLADRMAGVGGDVRLRVYEGMWHVWPMYGDFPEASAALDEIAHFVATVCPRP